MTYNHTLAEDARSARSYVQIARTALQVVKQGLEVHRYELAGKTITNTEFQALRAELKADYAELDRAFAHLDRLAVLLSDQDGELTFAQSQVADVLENMQGCRSISPGQAQYFLTQAVRAFDTDRDVDYTRWGLLHEAIFDGDETVGYTVKPGIDLDAVHRAVEGCTVWSNKTEVTP